MKNSTLLFRSLAIVILLGGIAHLATYASQNPNYYSKEHIDTDYSSQEMEESAEIKLSDEAYDQETDYIIGKWAVSYNTKDFTGTIVYDIKKEKTIFNAYTSVYEDLKGNAQQAEKSKTLTIRSFDGYKGKGTYTIDYKGETYEVDCNIDMIDENTFKLSYDYYGYSDTETWKRR